MYRNDASVKGGESVLIDMWAVVEQFRKEYPKHFNTLSTVRITCQRIHYGRYQLITSLSFSCMAEWYAIVNV